MANAGHPAYEHTVSVNVNGTWRIAVKLLDVAWPSQRLTHGAAGGVVVASCITHGDARRLEPAQRFHEIALSGEGQPFRVEKVSGNQECVGMTVDEVVKEAVKRDYKLAGSAGHTLTFEKAGARA